jgi:hypothetical protein
MPTPSEVDINQFNLLERLTYSPNMNTPDITLVVVGNGTKKVLLPINDANTQLNSLPELSRYAWNLDPTHKNPDGTTSKYAGSMNLKKIKFLDRNGRSMHDVLNHASSV